MSNSWQKKNTALWKPNYVRIDSPDYSKCNLGLNDHFDIIDKTISLNHDTTDVQTNEFRLWDWKLETMNEWERSRNLLY